MKLARISVALLAFVVLIAATPAQQHSHAKTGPCVSTIGQCPAEGCGGDAELNKLKNVEDAADNPQGMAIDDIVAIKQPKKWTSGQNRASLAELGEGDPVVIEGFIIHAKQAEAESCNCNLNGRAATDFHVNLVSDPDLTVDDSVVAEITPHIRPKGWTLTKLQSLAGERSYVRVTGYLLFDSQHVSVSGGPRATLWEIHPITAFEVCSGGNPKACQQGETWQPLEDF